MYKEQKELKLLYKYYNKKLKYLHNKNFNKLNHHLDYFINYLYFIRDALILTEPLEIEDQENPKISSLASAIEEFNLFRVSNIALDDLKINTLPKEDTEKAIKKQEEDCNKHWKLFWQLVAENIEGWTSDLNVTI